MWWIYNRLLWISTQVYHLHARREMWNLNPLPQSIIHQSLTKVNIFHPSARFLVPVGFPGVSGCRKVSRARNGKSWCSSTRNTRHFQNNKHTVERRRSCNLKSLLAEEFAEATSSTLLGCVLRHWRSIRFTKFMVKYTLGFGMVETVFFLQTQLSLSKLFVCFFCFLFYSNQN